MAKRIGDPLESSPAKYMRLADPADCAPTSSSKAAPITRDTLPGDLIREIIAHLGPDQQLAIRNFVSINQHFWNASESFRAGVACEAALRRIPKAENAAQAARLLERALTSLGDMHPIQQLHMLARCIESLPAFASAPMAWLTAFHAIVPFIPTAANAAEMMQRQPLLAALANQAIEAPRGIPAGQCRRLLQSAGLDAADRPPAWTAALLGVEDAKKILRNQASGSKDRYAQESALGTAIATLAKALPLLPDGEWNDVVDLMAKSLALLRDTPKLQDEALAGLCEAVSGLIPQHHLIACARRVWQSLPAVAEMRPGMLRSAALICGGATAEGVQGLFDAVWDRVSKGDVRWFRACFQILIQAPSQPGQAMAATMAAASHRVLRQCAPADAPAVTSDLAQLTAYLPPNQRDGHLNFMIDECIAWRRALYARRQPTQPAQNLARLLAMQVPCVESPDDRFKLLFRLAQLAMISNSKPFMEDVFGNFRHLGLEDRGRFLDEVLAQAPLDQLTDSGEFFSLAVMFEASAVSLDALSPEQRDDWVKNCLEHQEIDPTIEGNDPRAWWVVVHAFADVLLELADTLPQTLDLMELAARDKSPGAVTEPAEFIAALHRLDANWSRDEVLEEIGTWTQEPQWRQSAYEINRLKNLLRRSPDFPDLASRVAAADLLMDLLASKEERHNYIELLGMAERLFVTLHGADADRLLVRLVVLRDEIAAPAQPKVEEI